MVRLCSANGIKATAGAAGERQIGDGETVLRAHKLRSREQMPFLNMCRIVKSSTGINVQKCTRATEHNAQTELYQ